MTYAEFVSMCQTKTIDPDIAVENEYIRVALRARDDKLVEKLLDSEF